MTTLLAAIALGFAATALARWVACHCDIVSRPDPIIPDHVRPVPYLGGVAIVATTVAAGTDGRPLLLGLLLFMAVGLVDDLVGLRPHTKIAAQFLAAGIALVSCDQLARRFSGSVAIDAALSVLWIVFVVNAWNLIDVCDGLAGAVAVVVLLLWSMSPSFPAPLLIRAAAGATLGFLFWNAPPATIFMGDAGSHALGYLCAAATLLAPSASEASFWPWAPMAAFWTAVPLFEVVFLVVVRTRKQIRWWDGSPDHFALRLQTAGWKKWAIDLTSAASAALFWQMAWAFTDAGTIQQIVLLALLLAAGVLASLYLLRFEVDLPEH